MKVVVEYLEYSPFSQIDRGLPWGRRGHPASRARGAGTLHRSEELFFRVNEPRWRPQQSLLSTPASSRRGAVGLMRGQECRFLGTVASGGLGWDP